VIAAFFLALAAAALSGVVHDTSGAAVPGAVVFVRAAGGPERQAVTGPDGRFTIELPDSAEVTVRVRAGGFAETARSLTAAERGRDVTLVVEPATVLETVTVTPARGEERVIDVPASVSILKSEDIRQSPAVVADDVLRQVPTFSLFRRTSSLSSHPTAQGVSLRGIGPSGVSRTLVMIDGIPFNDPFGGWVYWTRVPLESVDRIEVVDGTSSMYGNYAMGGVINIMSSRPAARTVELKPQYGTHNSPKFDFFASDVWGKLGAVVEGSAFDTEGFPIVIANERGRVDNKAAVNFANVNVKLDYNPTPGLNAFFRGGYFRENRDNAKASTIDGTEEANDTRWKHAAGGVRMLLGDGSDLQARLYTDVETFHSNFLAVPAANPPRSIGRMTLNQTVPTKSVGTVVQWGRAFGPRQFVQAGTDWRWVDGESQEDGLDAVVGQTVTLRRLSGGTQRSIGAFVQDIISPATNLTVTLGLRVDHWSNYNGHNLESSVPSGVPTANDRLLPDRSDTVASPRIAAVYHVSDRVNVWGNLATGFRAPTLNELYRQFRVGTVLTLANDQLGPERLIGGEAGVNVLPTRKVSVRGTWYDNHVRNPVSNVTRTTQGAAVTQQRDNLGRTRIQGLQAEVEYRPLSAWRLSGGYLYNHATVKEYDANTALVGNFLPQVPKHRGSIQASYVDPKVVGVTLGLQFIGRQFDDDQNIRTVPGDSKPGLPGYLTADVMITRVVSRNLDLFLGAQNLFNEEYIVGTLPTTIGSPRLVNAGLRIRFSGQ
jgi:outer membrane receptor protein involved in Fe transport